ncbi:hypothetical protein IP92_03103 [Pseudoduganella flava]|uniref:Uncharacterized protein n=1 Tax=Pseudoduganella flava TaxID=871742 RepID=A0A562PRE5_9BURK|nr:hypothetical protein [Pseudoduganella flava]QGZ37904.1 hypothetical protein GO485_01795 [Pseudoduganella flava]TWI46740.1 hypothetical protein IP92_03103 [Pseudoduganella flava]
MRKLIPFAFAAAALAQHAGAAELSGTWRFEKSADYHGQTKIPAPKSPVLQIVNQQAAFSPSCLVKLDKARYAYSEPFQGLLKEGVDEPKLEKYLGKNFGFSITGSKDYYEADVDSDCNGMQREFLVSGDKLLVPVAGSGFYSYVRSDGGTAAAVDPKLPLGGRKLSQLPFSVPAYTGLCLDLVPLVKGVPQATAKCAPVYYPYVANAKDADALAKLIGNHDYKKGGGSHAADYAPPFASKLHPTFAVLPPLKDVLLVRVDDLEGGNEKRDVMSGVFLAIKDGKVTDQLNEGCTIDTAYNCVDADGKKQYQLLESGKFKKLP